MTNISAGVAQLRAQVYHGSCIDLVPYTPEFAPEIVRLRNLPEVRYFLNQAQESTLASQLAWSRGYSQRQDDIFWILRNKSGNVVGCNRLYDINPSSAEKGSQIVDPEFARALPIALEADLRAIQLTFNVLGLPQIVAVIRHDNDKTRSMNLRLGFKEINRENIRGIPYVRYALAREAFQPAAFEKILDHWSKRNERR